MAFISKKIRLIILLLLFVLIFILYGWLASNRGGYQGYIEAENLYIASPNAGALIHLAVHEGKTVKKGELLFQLDPNPQALLIKQYEHDITQANYILQNLIKPRRTPEINAIKAQIDQVEVNLDLAKIRVKRDQDLYKKNAIDKDSVDAAIAMQQQQEKLKEQYLANLDLAQMGNRDEEIEAQKEQINSLKAKLAESIWQLEQKTVASPSDGIIFDHYFDEGEYVANQQPVVSLLTKENVYVQFFVPAEQVSLLKLGQKVTFLCDGCDKPSDADIYYISPEAEYLPPLVYSRENSDKLVFRIKARFAEFNEFKPGQPVMVYIRNRS